MRDCRLGATSAVVVVVVVAATTGMATGCKTTDGKPTDDAARDGNVNGSGTGVVLVATAGATTAVGGGVEVCCGVAATGRGLGLGECLGGTVEKGLGDSCAGESLPVGA